MGEPPTNQPLLDWLAVELVNRRWSLKQVDTFDHKPALAKYAGEPIDGKVAGDIIVRQGFPGPLMPSPFAFKRYGQSGIEISEIFPHLSQHADEIAFVRSVYGRSNDHVQGTYEMQTGQINLGFPSVGSWVTYGLGFEASSLPAFVVMTDARGGARSPVRAAHAALQGSAALAAYRRPAVRPCPRPKSALSRA